MAFGREIASRFLKSAKGCSGQIRSGFRSFESQVFRRVIPDSGDRFIHLKPMFPPAVPPDPILIPTGLKLFDQTGVKLPDRNSIGMPISVEGMKEKRGAMGMSVDDVRKVMKATQMELVKSKLREIPKSFVSLSEFLRICCEVSSEEQGPELARSMDESAAVIVIGNTVLLRPDQE